MVHLPAIMNSRNTSADMPAYAAIVLAGGAGRRLGGAAKPALPVGGAPMLHRVLAAVADAELRVVVGPPDLPLPDQVMRTQERPPGGGPVAATAAGLAALPAGSDYVALLAADLPLLTGAAVARLRLAALAYGGAIYADPAGRPQWLCGVWRVAALRGRLPADPAGLPLHRLLGGLPVARLTGSGDGPQPWWDCDTEADLRRAQEIAKNHRPPAGAAERSPRSSGRNLAKETRMATLDEWTVAACEALGLDPADGSAHRDVVLDLARDTAHGVVRPAAPLTAYLLGLAVGRGADPAAAARTLTAMARDWPSSPPAE